MSVESKGNRFIAEEYDNLASEPYVLKASGEGTPELDDVGKVSTWLATFHELHHSHKNNPEVYRRVKNSYYKKYVIKEDNVSDSYFENQRRILREQGHGDIELTDRRKAEVIRMLQRDQQTSLDSWIDYLGSDEAEVYPMWAKYWAFRGMTQLSKYDPENQKFGTRNESTVAPFPELNAEALSKTINFMTTKFGSEFGKLDDELQTVNDQINLIRKYDRELNIIRTGRTPEGRELPVHVLKQMNKRLVVPESNDIEELIRTKSQLELAQLDILGIDDKTDRSVLGVKSFSDLYSRFYTETQEVRNENLQNTDGNWVKYNQGEDAITLFNSLQSKGTGWCTAGGIETAQKQLNSGDFYVFYSYENAPDGDPTLPRVAIRMFGDEIQEVRGIAEKQNLDPYITDVVDEKLSEFGLQGELYRKRIADMRALTEIEKKTATGDELSKEEIRFLYEMEGTEIQGFGYERDPRIEEIKSKRDMREDIGSVFGVKAENLGISIEDLMDENRNVTFYYGDFTITESEADKIVRVPKEVYGNVYVRNYETRTCPLPTEKVHGSVKISGGNFENVRLPNEVTGLIELHAQTIDELTLPEKYKQDTIIDDDVNDQYVNEVSDIEVKHIGILVVRSSENSVEMSELRTVGEIRFPTTLNNYISFPDLESIGEMYCPQILRGSLYLNSLREYEYLSLPHRMEGILGLRSLERLSNLRIPNVWGLETPSTKDLGTLDLNGKVGKLSIFADKWELTPDEQAFKDKNPKVVLSHQNYIGSMPKTTRAERFQRQQDLFIDMQEFPMDYEY